MFLATSPPKDFAALCSLLLFSSSRVCWMMRGSVAIVCTSTIGTQPGPPRFILPLNSTPHYRLAHIFPVNRGRDSRCRHIEPSKKKKIINHSLLLFLPGDFFFLSFSLAQNLKKKRTNEKLGRKKGNLFRFLMTFWALPQR